MTKHIGQTHVQHADYRTEPDNRPRCRLDCTLYQATGPAIGDDYLRLESFQGQDGISQPFEYQLQFKANDTVRRQDLELDFSAVIGQLAVVRLGVPSPALPASEPGEWLERQWQFTYFTGMVTNFSMAEPGSYRATLKPFLWKLNLANDYQIYGRGADKGAISIAETIQQVLERHQIRYRMEFPGSSNPATTRKQNWLQAGESDFQFLSTLLDMALIYYFFEHDASGHTLVLSNTTTSYQELYRDGTPLALRYTFTQTDGNSLDQDDLVTSYLYEQSLNTSLVRSTVVRTEAAWEENKVARFSIYNGLEEKVEQGTPLAFHRYDIWQYGGSQEHAQTHAKMACSSAAAASSKFSGSSTCELLKPGFKFTLVNGVPLARPELEGTGFVVTQVQHQCQDSGPYQNSFEATEPAELITPFQLRNTHQGMIIGRVSTPPAEPADWRYYAKNSFNWDQQTCQDSASQDPALQAKGIWVALSTDGPQAPPVWIKLAQHMQTVPEPGATVLVSRSSDESQLPEIQSIIQANGSQVIMPAGWTANTNVGNGYSTSYGDGKRISYGKESTPDLPTAEGIVEDQYKSGDYKDVSFSQGASYSYSTAETGKSGLLSRSESFGSTYSKHHGAVSDSYSDIGLSTSTSTIGASISRSTMTTSDSTSAIGASTNSSAIGASNSNSAVGASNNNSATGVSVNVAVTGENDNLSATGVSNNVSVTGSSKNLNVVGLSTDITVMGGGIKAFFGNQPIDLTAKPSTFEATFKSGDVEMVGTITMTM